MRSQRIMCWQIIRDIVVTLEAMSRMKPCSRWELADFIMERKMMKTIKTLAEEEELALAEKA